MTLLEAMRIVGSGRSGNGASLDLRLLSGFTPLHLDTFLRAHLKLRAPERPVSTQHGLYGDLLGSVQDLASGGKSTAACVMIEWPDLDPRLGWRSLGGWTSEVQSDILRSSEVRASELALGLEAARMSRPLVVSLPGLPIPPMEATSPIQAGSLALKLRAIVGEMALVAAGMKHVRVLNQQEIDITSPLALRADYKSEVASGFPYSLNHAERLAAGLAQLLLPAEPLRGLITDLDGTLWRGIVGDVGVEGIAWSLDGHAQRHGLYQQMLGSLADSGVLLAIASKNERKRVDEALERPDMIIPSSSFFPVEAHWEEKSGSVRRILDQWNISEASVVLVDDSQIELDEVGREFPALTRLRFPQDDRHMVEFILTLRKLFGREAVSQEDRLRASSIRKAPLADLANTPDELGVDAFHASLDGEVVIQLNISPDDVRSFELVNKTNQFNLNGRRVTESEWMNYLSEPGVFSGVVSYSDKYGPLGKIAVFAGRLEERLLCLDYWVMSCRAFSRRIEYACLNSMYDLNGADAIRLEFCATDRNSPLVRILRSLDLNPESPPLILHRDQFYERCPRLHQSVRSEAIGDRIHA